MADILSRIKEQQTLNDNRDLQQAETDARWANNFSKPTSPEVLRSNLRLAETIDRVEGNRLRLQAQGDIKALSILQKQREADEWMRQAPLREEKLIRQVESTGAYDRFRVQKDNETQADVAGFFSEMSQGKERPGTPEYQQKLNGVLQKYPRVIGTQVGQDALKNLQKEHTDLASILPKEGERIARTEFDENGGFKVVMEPIPQTAVPPGLVPTGARTDASGNTAVTYGSPKEASSAVSRDLAREQSAYDKASQRRIAAQKAYDAALKSENKDLITLNKDLINAADADIIEAKKQIDALRAPAAPTAQQTFSTADEIKAAYRARAMTREAAEAALKAQFGFE